MDSEIEHRIDAIFQSIQGSLDDQAKFLDSIAYVEILIAVQNEFKIKFLTQEFSSLRSMENIRASIHQKLRNR